MLLIVMLAQWHYYMTKSVLHSRIKLHGPLILVLESIHGYSDVDQELEKRGSLKNNISLANWNECLTNLMKLDLRFFIFNLLGVEF